MNVEFNMKLIVEVIFFLLVCFWIYILNILEIIKNNVVIKYVYVYYMICIVNKCYRDIYII